MYDVRPGSQGRIGTPPLLALSSGYLALSATAFLLVQPPGGAATPALWFPPIGLAYGGTATWLAVCALTQRRPWHARPTARDLTRASVVLAGCALLLGATAEARFGDSLSTFQLQSVKFAAATAALLAGAVLVAEAGAARREAVQATRWRALVGVAPAVVALAWERSHDRATDLPNRDLLLATTEHLLAEGSTPGSTGGGPEILGDGPGSSVTDHDKTRGDQTRNRDETRGTTTCLVLVDVDRAGWRAELFQLDPAQLMLTLAERLRGLLNPRSLADGRALVARTGDDQFGLLVPGDADACRALAARMVAALRRAVPTPRGPISVTAWAGVAQLEPGRPALETLRLAATALHAAIERHHQPVVVLDDLSVTTTEQRARLIGEVAGAVDRGELEVAFQPDVRLPDGRLSGVEALVRWRRPEGFATATDLFVRLAEEAGAVQAVDAWVMEESLGRLSSWLREHRDCDLELALNISPLSLTEDLPDRLFETCLRHDVPPWHVRLEVTESALADDSTAPEVLRRLRSRGSRVALNDFGTGYASLSRLHRLPVDVVKLDRSVLPPIIEDQAGRSLVSLVLGLAGPLRVEVVVEGVETPQQRDLLIYLGCRRAQGFLFARPCRPETIDELLASGLPLGGLSATPTAPPGPGRASGGAWAGPADYRRSGRRPRARRGRRSDAESDRQ